MTARRAASLAASMVARSVNVWHVVGGQEQIRDGCHRPRPEPPRVDEVDEQRLGVGLEQRIDIEIQVPVDQVLVLEHVGALHVQAALQLVPDLVPDLATGALPGGLPVQAGRVPVGDVDRDHPADVSVAEAAQVDVSPELRLGHGRERPWGSRGRSGGRGRWARLRRGRTGCRSSRPCSG